MTCHRGLSIIAYLMAIKSITFRKCAVSANRGGRLVLQAHSAFCRSDPNQRHAHSCASLSFKAQSYSTSPFTVQRGRDFFVNTRLATTTATSDTSSGEAAIQKLAQKSQTWQRQVILLS